MKNFSFHFAIILIFLLISASPGNCQDGHRAYNRGIKQANNANYQKAGKSFEKAFQHNYFPGYYTLGLAALAYNLAENNEKAMECLLLAEKNASAVYYFCQAELRGKEFSLKDKAQLKGAHLYDSIFNLLYSKRYSERDERVVFPDFLPAIFSYVYYDTEQYDSSIYYSDIGLNYLSLPEFILNKGDCYLELGLADSSLKYYMRALDFDSAQFDAQTGLAESYLTIKQFDQALFWINKAIELDSLNIYTLQIKACILSDLNKYKEAMDILNQLLILYPDDAYTYYIQGDIYFDLEDYEHAISAYGKYLKFFPGDEDAIYNMDAARENMEIEIGDFF